MSDSYLVKVVPAKPNDGADGAHMTQGTKVMVGDSEIRGVTSVELHAGVNDVWRAVIHCHCQPVNVTAEGLVITSRHGIIRRIWNAVFPKQRDATDIADTHRKYDNG